MGFDNDCILFIYNVASEYFCSVCRTLVYPNEALQTPCTHLYCKPCLLHIASTTQACPYDGHLVTEAGSKPLVESNKALAEMIGKVVVRCNYHRSGCTWQGPLSECIIHRSICAFGYFLVICTKCGIQVVHRQVEEHAQNCNINQIYPQNPYSHAGQGHGQQHPLLVHQSTGSITLDQLTARFAQPTFPLRPLEPPQRLPPQGHINLHGQLQLPQVSSGYTYGLGQSQSQSQLHHPGSYQSGSFTFYPRYQLGGSSAPFSAGQSDGPLYGPTGFASSSPSVPAPDQGTGPSVDSSTFGRPRFSSELLWLLCYFKTAFGNWKQQCSLKKCGVDGYFLKQIMSCEVNSLKAFFFVR